MGNQTYIAQYVQIKQLTYFGHVNRTANIRLPWIATWIPNGNRKREKSRKTYSPGKIVK